jgi:hypothetical protein
MATPFTITSTKSRSTFNFEDYYKLLEEVKQTYSIIDPTLLATSPTYAEDSKAAYGQPSKPDLIKKFENILFIDVGPIARDYVKILREFLAQKYPNLSPPISNVSTEDTRIKEEYLSISEMKKYLTVDGYNSYIKYWQAYQDYRAITPKYPQRSTPGKQEYNDPLVFGRRNANLFIPYIAPIAVLSASQVNQKTLAQQKQNQQQQNNVNLTKNMF